MINLLSPTTQNAEHRERLMRKAVALALLGLALIAAGLLLLMPTRLYLRDSEAAAEVVLAEIAASRASLGDARDRAIADANDEIHRLEKAFVVGVHAQKVLVLRAILASIPPGVKIQHLSVDEAHVSLDGEAVSREALVLFARALEKQNSFAKVLSPVSNLLKNKNLHYSLTMDLRP